jgi:hypothetical protein
MKMIRTQIIPDFKGIVQVNDESKQTGEDDKFKKVGAIRLYKQASGKPDLPQLKGYIGINGKFYEVSLWNNAGGE